MKKSIYPLTLVLIITFANLLISTSLFGQAPEAFTYQAIVRDNTGQPLPNTTVTFQFNILQGSASGILVYSENHAATTNGFGLVNLQIGQGTVNSGAFSTIDWGNDAFFLNIQIDQGSGFIDMGTQQFISVPYAMYAKNAGSSGVAGNSGDVQLNDNGSLGADPDLHWDFTDKKFVVGQDTSDGRMIIQQDVNAPDSIPILEVKNKLGQTIFVVYPDSVHIFIDDDNTKGVLKGGFAVSGRSGTKAVTNDYLLVRPDSTRIWTQDTIAGFGVRNLGGGSETSYMQLNPNNYFIGESSGQNITTGLYNSTFGYETGKNLTTGNQNVFLGYRAGKNNTSGSSNLFMGVEAGINNLTGNQNVFMGNASGVASQIGNWNVYVGDSAGYNNEGYYNLLMGYCAGKNNNTWNNVFLGAGAGEFCSSNNNIFIGNSAGMMNKQGNNVFIGLICGNNDTLGQNVMIGGYAGSSGVAIQNSVLLGYESGRLATGSNNVFLGYQAGYNESGSNKLYIENSNSSSPLIYGEFDNDIVAINGNLGAGTMTPTHRIHAVDNTPSVDNAAVYGIHAITDGWGIGVYGEGKYRGVVGNVSSSTSISATGGYFSVTNTGSGTTYGIYATTSTLGTGTHYAGYFNGDVHVNGTLSKNAGSFKIDDPRDPANKYLIHSFVESPDMKNVYDGVITLDQNGKAVVVLPDYFEVLNKDFRYLLTAIGSPAPDLYIEQEVQNNTFVIAGGNPGQKISWQVTGIRKDPYAQAHPIIPIVEKTGNEKGKYLNPELYHQPKTKGIGYIKQK